ncbi:hypothetical protein Ancab_022914 [Ancistrocladus abbreviatus]
MGEEAQAKWEGKITAEMKRCKVEEVWPLISDFCSLHKWHPAVKTCYRIEGFPGQAGLIRYCAGAPSSDGDDHHNSVMTIKWCKEKLISIDPEKKCFSYEIVDNNCGFKSYVATIELLSLKGIINDADHHQDGDFGCMIEWSFVADPIEGWRLDDLASFIDYVAKTMATRMEEALVPQCKLISMD